MQAQILTIRLLCTVLAIAFCICNPLEVSGREPDPLFQSDKVLSITITGPFNSINRERDKAKNYADAQLIFQNQQSNDVHLDVRLQVRGNFRLQKDVCRFAPLRIHFNKKQVEGTLFDKQGKLKLVTHCQSGSKRQYLLQEYMAYRIFNLLSDYSFKVRLAEVSYVNTERSNNIIRGYGFFIEDKKRLGIRKGMKPIDSHRVKVADLDPHQANLVSTFQFMIGNTDWSILSGERDEACCHNAKLLGNEDSKYFPIPYDFDFSGLINAHYAAPAPNMPIKNVRTRFYRGFCESNGLLNGTLDRYRVKKESIYSLFANQQQLQDKTISKSHKYLDSFYTLIDNPRAIERKLIKHCR